MNTVCTFFILIYNLFFIKCYVDNESCAQTSIVLTALSYIPKMVVTTTSKISKSVEIAPGVFMPMIGIGTWEMKNKDVLRDVLDAGFAAGYRFIDTAYLYENEKLIGEILKDLLPKYQLRRQDIFITSKLPTSHFGAKLAEEAFHESTKHLDTDYLDLYLIHFPRANNVDHTDHERLKKLRRETWLELEKLKNQGKIRAIGVSNYMTNHLEEMNEYASIKPAVDQCEFHPHCNTRDVLDYCRKHNIHFQAYSSLGGVHSHGVLLQEPLIVDMSRKYACQPAQLLLAWALNQNVSVLPKTTNADRVSANLASLDLVLEKTDIDKIGSLSTDTRYCWDPTTVA